MALFSDGGFCRQAYQETEWHRPHPCPRCSSVGATTTTTAISLIIMASSPFSSTLLHCSMSVRTLVMTSRIPYHHHHHCHHHHQRHQCASFFHFFPKTSEPPHTLWLHQHGHQGITPSPTPLFTLFSSFFFFFSKGLRCLFWVSSSGAHLDPSHHDGEQRDLQPCLPLHCLQPHPPHLRHCQRCPSHKQDKEEATRRKSLVLGLAEKKKK